jgi:hypothetical protein
LPTSFADDAVTTTNALFFAYQTASREDTRQLVMLQNAAFLPLFRTSMGTRRVRELSVTELQPSQPTAQDPQAFEAIFEQLNRDRVAAARQALGFLNETGRAQDLIDAARALVFSKGDDPHDYKFSSAVLEDYHHVSPAWRNRYLAANLFKMRGSGEPDNALVTRARQALG